MACKFKAWRLSGYGSGQAGNVIGRARVYDYKLQNTAYSGNTSVFELSLFDIQTNTNLTVNTAHTIPLPAVIEGARSGARGYLSSAVSNSTSITLSQTSGQFILDEPIIINDVQDGRIITAVTEFDLADVKSVRSTGGGRTFSADVVLEPVKNFAGKGFNITTAGAVTSGSTGWTKNFKVGDIIAYNLSGITDTVFNRVSAVNPTAKSLTVVVKQTLNQLKSQPDSSSCEKNIRPLR